MIESDNNIEMLLRNINEKITNMIPSGETYDAQISVTDSVYLFDKVGGNPLNWMSFSLYNRGPSPVYYSVNEWIRPAAPMEVGDTITVDLKQRGAIRRIYLVCDAGTATTVDIHALK